MLPLLAVAVWSRDWIGCWSLIPTTLSLIFVKINPVLFPRTPSCGWTSTQMRSPNTALAGRNAVDIPPSVWNA